MSEGLSRRSFLKLAATAGAAAAIAAGLGGGLLFANIVAPHEPKYAAEPTKLEQRMAVRSIPVTSTPSEPVPYLAATQPAAATPVVAAAPAQTVPDWQKKLSTGSSIAATSSRAVRSSVSSGTFF